MDNAENIKKTTLISEYNILVFSSLKLLSYQFHLTHCHQELYEESDCAKQTKIFYTRIVNKIDGINFFENEKWCETNL